MFGPPIQFIEIDDNSRKGWERFTENFDVVPDPMIMRTGELFLNGRSGAVAANLDPDAVWECIDKNLGGLLAFFDAIVTRDRLPVIQYWETFPSPSRDIIGLLGPELAIPVRISHAIYEKIRDEILHKMAGYAFDRIPADLLADIPAELGAFAYEWHPWLGDLNPSSDQRPAVEFLVSGLVFGAYAQATSADHLVQAKRSRLMLALSAPRPEMTKWRFEQEEALFNEFRNYYAKSDNVRVRDFKSPPSILPYLLTKKPRGVLDVLQACIELRNQDMGHDYRQWWKDLRFNWSEGRSDPAAERDVAKVINRIKKRMGGGRDSKNGPTLEFGFSAGVTANISGIPLGLPGWLQLWIAEAVDLRQHRRLLLRMSLAQAMYKDVTLHLKRLWVES